MMNKVMLKMKWLSYVGLVFLLATTHTLGSAAENPVVDSQRIIEALKPKPTVKTRSLRNLKVAPVAPPSLSLTIGFEFDSAELSAQSASQLKELNAAIGSIELAQLEFRIEGHTDGKGAPSYNLRLSERRAATVKNFLVTAGISVERLKAEGKGATELAFPNSPLAAENRRVKIVTLNQ